MINNDDILLGKLRGDHLRFPAVGLCIYCGLVPDDPKELTDEHIVPLALNGNMILPRASCRSCGRITSSFEGIVTRGQFGAFRAQRGYQTRRNGKRARATRLITYITKAGEHKTKTISVLDYPTAYIAVAYEPPGILTGAEPSDENPPMTVATMFDPKEYERAVAAIGEPVLHIVSSLQFRWRPFSLTLAKIAHSFMVAAVGTKGYIALLPKVIIGKPGTGGFLSFYVGGLGGSPAPDWMFARHHVLLEFSVLQNAPTPGLYAVAHIALVGGARMPTYQVVAAQITDYPAVETAARNSILYRKYPTGFDSPAAAPVVISAGGPPTSNSHRVSTPLNSRGTIGTRIE